MKTIEDIKEAMKDRNATVVAEKIGIHRQTIYDIMSGKRNSVNFATYQKLVDYLFPDQEK